MILALVSLASGGRAAISKDFSYLRVIGPLTLTAGGIEFTKIEVNVKDENGNPVGSGNSVTLNTIGVPDNNSKATDSNGQCTFTLTSLYAGTDIITATCGGKTITSLIAGDLAGGVWFFDARTIRFPRNLLRITQE